MTIRREKVSRRGTDEGQNHQYQVPSSQYPVLLLMAHLLVITHKACWSSTQSPTGYATDGGFPVQMEALSHLFDSTTLMLPSAGDGPRPGEMPLRGHGLRVMLLSKLAKTNWGRKLSYPFWLLWNLPRLLRAILRTDAVHALIPGDVGVAGMILAVCFGKPLLVRHCGNWLVQQTTPDRFCRWFMERFAGGRNVMLATGGDASPPSAKNPEVRWIFSTSLWEEELRHNAAQQGKSLPDTPRLIIASRQEKAKGTATIIEALPLVLARFPAVRLDVVGDGSYLETLKAQVNEFGLRSHVTFHGKVDHETVLRLLQRADIFCFPTTSSEGFPKGVVEALSCGLPVVTTRVSVLPQLIETGCGLLLGHATPQALANAVIELLAQPQRYQAMSRQAIVTARSFTLENWRDKIGGYLRTAWSCPLRMTAAK